MVLKSSNGPINDVQRPGCLYFQCGHANSLGPFREVGGRTGPCVVPSSSCVPFSIVLHFVTCTDVQLLQPAFSSPITNRSCNDSDLWDPERFGFASARLGFNLMSTTVQYMINSSLQHMHACTTLDSTYFLLNVANSPHPLTTLAICNAHETQLLQTSSSSLFTGPDPRPAEQAPALSQVQNG